MSLRDFLLDYAERAPTLQRVSDSHMRFGYPGRYRSLCPLEAAHGGTLNSALEYYKLAETQDCSTVIGAADGGWLDGSRPGELYKVRRVWRHILEKLAEPEVA